MRPEWPHWLPDCMEPGMSVAASQPRNSGLASWFESAGSLPARTSSPAQGADVFVSKLHAAVEGLETGEKGETVSGLARVFSTEPQARAEPESEQEVSRSGTAAPTWHRQEAGESSRDAVQGIFRDVPEDSIEPDNAILFWRRPADPPPISWQSKLVLAEAIRRAGYDPKEFAVSYWETRGEWPGGMMIVRELTLVAPDGRKIDMSADLIVGCPDAAVADVQRLMNWRPPAPGALAT